MSEAKTWKSFPLLPKRNGMHQGDKSRAEMEIAGHECVLCFAFAARVLLERLFFALHSVAIDRSRTEIDPRLYGGKERGRKEKGRAKIAFPGGI